MKNIAAKRKAGKFVFLPSVAKLHQIVFLELRINLLIILISSSYYVSFFLVRFGKSCRLLTVFKREARSTSGRNFDQRFRTMLKRESFSFEVGTFGFIVAGTPGFIIDEDSQNLDIRMV